MNPNFRFAQKIKKLPMFKMPLVFRSSRLGWLLLVLAVQFALSAEAEAQLMGQGRTSTAVARKLDPFRDPGRTWNRQIRTIRQGQQQTKKILKTASPSVSQPHRRFVRVHASKFDEQQAWFDRRKNRSGYVF